MVFSPDSERSNEDENADSVNIDSHSEETMQDDNRGNNWKEVAECLLASGYYKTLRSLIVGQLIFCGEMYVSPIGTYPEVSGVITWVGQLSDL